MNINKRRAITFYFIKVGFIKSSEVLIVILSLFIFSIFNLSVIQKTERDYKEWMEERKEAVMKDFKDLLKETKIITYKSLKMIQENEQHLRDILAVLEVGSCRDFFLL